MKKIVVIVTLTIGMFGCSKKRNTDAKVIRNCTGIYLNVDNKNYKVCNRDILQNYENEEPLTATFKKAEDCDLQSELVCFMHFDFEHYIEIKDIKE
ncbi:MAG: hypothetical protein MRY83_24920 [Flavobacteriales bacterium]|nr:hypothetical protein [Flavobacteriales bacterium]